MGYMCHHAIIVTTYRAEHAQEAHDKATSLGMSVTSIVGPVTNGYRTFLVGPDGSKEGWGTSDQGDERRAEFIDWIRTQSYEDGSTWFDWAEVQYGDEDGDTRIIRDSDEGQRGYVSGRTDWCR